MQKVLRGSTQPWSTSLSRDTNFELFTIADKICIILHNLGLLPVVDKIFMVLNSLGILYSNTQPWADYDGKSAWVYTALDFCTFSSYYFSRQDCSFLHKNGLSTIVYRIFKFLHKPMSMIADSMQTLNVGINTVDVHE